MVESQVLKHTCVVCNGEGMIYSVVDIAYPINKLWVTCPHCDGTGYEEEKKE